MLRRIQFLALSLVAATLWLAPLDSATAQPKGCTTPRQAVDTFLYWQTSKTKDINKAIACIDTQAGPVETRKGLAKNLLFVLDQRLLWVKIDRIPDEANYTDGDTGAQRYTLFPKKLPEIYVERTSQGRWIFPAQSMAQVPGLFKKTRGTAMAHIKKVIPPALQGEVFGVGLWQLLALLALIFLGLLLRKIVIFVTGRWLSNVFDKVFHKWGREVAACMNRPMGTLAMVSVIAAALPMLALPIRFSLIVTLALKVVASMTGVWGLYRLVDVMASYFSEKAEGTETKLDDQLVPLARKTAKVFVVIVGALFVLQNLDVDVMSLVAGLGIGGLAFALAAQDTIKNLFGSVMIFADRPFQIGDWISAAGTEGVVEEVGVRSTRVRTFYNSLVTIPNSKIADALIDNYGQRTYRRISVTLNLSYSTTPEQMQAFCEGVRAILQSNEWTRKDFYLVHFKDFGPHSLDVMMYCFLKVPDWNKEMQERQNIFLEIMRLTKELGVEFAFPTQTIHVDSMSQASASPQVADKESQELKAIVEGFAPNGGMANPSGNQYTKGYLSG